MSAAISRIFWQLSATGNARTGRAAARLARTLAVALFAAFAMLALCANALAAGHPVDVGTPYEVDGVAVATASDGDAVVAWINDKGLAGARDSIEYCVLPVGAVACAYTSKLEPAGGAEYIDGVQVLDDGGTLVVLADVYGHAPESDIPEQEWQSTDGGATFSQIDKGASVTSGILNADTAPVGAVVLPGTGELGYGWITAGGSPTFDAFPLSSPPECSVKSCGAGFAKLEPESNPDQVGNPAGSSFASTLGATPGVIGVFPTDETAGPLGCSTDPDFGMAFAYGSGEQSATNNYDIEPGKPKSAWQTPVTEGDCGVEYPAAGGGPSGLGVLEDSAAAGGVVYHRFDQGTDKFDTPTALVSSDYEEQPSLSQDGAGGVYAIYLANLDEVRLAYSSDGGTAWSGPNTLSAYPSGGIGNLTSSVNETGQGWAAWYDSETGSVYAQSFTAADSVATPTATTLTTTQHSGTTSGANISIPAGTVGESDQATVVGENAADAGGSVSYSLYSSSSCSGAAVYTSPAGTPVTGGVAGSSGPITAALAPGTYYWVASYSGDSRNDASRSACGSEVLTVTSPATPPPSGEFKVGSIVVSESGGTITITIVPAQSGEATITVTIATGSIASVDAEAAKAKRCKHGQSKIKGKCRPSSTVVGSASGKGTAGVPLKLTVHLSGKVRSLLKKGRTVHLTGRLSYRSALGGKAVVHTIGITVKGRRHKKK